MKELITILMLCMMACRTVKTSIKDKEELASGTKLNTATQMAKVKERDVVMYWPDGSVYSFEQMREQVDQVKSAKMDVEERQMSTRNEVVKQREPWDFWIYGGIVLALVILCWIYKMTK